MSKLQMYLFYFFAAIVVWLGILSFLHFLTKVYFRFSSVLISVVSFSVFEPSARRAYRLAGLCATCWRPSGVMA